MNFSKFIESLDFNNSNISVEWLRESYANPPLYHWHKACYYLFVLRGGPIFLLFRKVGPCSLCLRSGLFISWDHEADPQDSYIRGANLYPSCFARWAIISNNPLVEPHSSWSERQIPERLYLLLDFSYPEVLTPSSRSWTLSRGGCSPSSSSLVTFLAPCLVSAKKSLQVPRNSKCICTTLLGTLDPILLRES